MIDCRDLYLISSQMSKALQNEDLAFGRLNLIMAGDFAQLPPVSAKGPALYSHTVSTLKSTTNAVREQKRSIGKAIWHQFTVVVILRQNMHQKTQSEGDAKFPTMLENLRYCSCTADDIRLLESRIPGSNNPDVDLTKPDFRNISIITGINSHRDKI
ncbi:hypothetical protein OF83DRAFT_1027745, partial [Amylostereum chailletii]